MIDKRADEMVRELLEYIESKPRGSWIAEMFRHYHRYGHFRREDMSRLIGGPDSNGVQPTMESIRDELIAEIEKLKQPRTEQQTRQAAG